SEHAHLREGVSVLCASRASESAVEEGGRGLFTALVTEALYGDASDLLGRVTIADIYAFVDRNLRVWDQRPLFKCHVSSMTSLRNCDPKIELSVLRSLPQYFPTLDFEFRLDPSYEPEFPQQNEEKGKAYRDLRAYRAVGLLEAVDHPHMYWTAMNSKAVR